MPAPRLPAKLTPGIQAHMDQIWVEMRDKIGPLAKEDFQARIDEVETCSEEAEKLGDERLASMLSGTSLLLMKVRCDYQAIQAEKAASPGEFS